MQTSAIQINSSWGAWRSWRIQTIVYLFVLIMYWHIQAWIDQLLLLSISREYLISLNNVCSQHMQFTNRRGLFETIMVFQPFCVSSVKATPRLMDLTWLLALVYRNRQTIYLLMHASVFQTNNNSRNACETRIQTMV